MRLTGSLFLIAVGAILTFAIHVQTNGFSLHTIGIILMIVGGAALVLTLALFSRRQRTVVRRGPAGEVVEERRTPDYSGYYDDAPRL
jgi:hypothetical protein